MDAIRGRGHARFVHKGDQEASLKALKAAAVMQMEGLVRTHRDAVEQLLGIKCEHDSPVVP
eukprot:8742457-Prorocentrum_lima.AAC.1